MTFLYDDPRFLDHQTGNHPERPERLVAVSRHLQRVGLDVLCQRPEWQPASDERLLRVHAAGYLQELVDFEAAGGGRIESDTVVHDRSVEVARLAAGAVCDAVERVVASTPSHLSLAEPTPRPPSGWSAKTAAAAAAKTSANLSFRTALCLVRPPGHHALAGSAMGFCLFNNVAVAARMASEELGLDRIMIVDWDVHHGNGTQDAFYADSQVSFLSIHRWPFYPGTGAADETGTRQGLGTTVNLPTPFGTARSDYLKSFRSAVEKLADRTRPQLILVSAGFDSHRDDPVGSLGLEVEDFIDLTRVVLDVANVHAGGRVVSVLEGGYNPAILAGCVEVHLRALIEAGG